jgi:hypothetical protein
MRFAPLLIAVAGCATAQVRDDNTDRIDRAMGGDAKIPDGIAFEAPPRPAGVAFERPFDEMGDMVQWNTGRSLADEVMRGLENGGHVGRSGMRRY